MLMLQSSPNLKSAHIPCAASETMHGQCIVCFAKDWDEDPTSNNHVMVELARENKVLWLNSVCTRKPNLRSPRDLKKIVQKLASFFRGVRRVNPNLWVYTPIVIPLPYSRMATALNHWIMRLSLKILSRKLGMREFQLWTFLPSTASYVGQLGESLVVYYCVDEWSKFNYLDGQRTADAERQLCERADIVFVSAQSLAPKRRDWNPETHLSRHGVDHALFAKALSASITLPDDISSVPGPVIGFYGTLQDWVDLDLIAFLAERHPEWSFVLIGKPMIDLERITRFPNVRVLGSRPHHMLPNYCKAFAVGIIPYVVNERIRHVNPIKLREYLSAGLPVVSVRIPEVEAYEDKCSIADDYKDFERAIARALAIDTPQKRVERSQQMKDETWRRRVRELGVQVMRVKSKLCRSK